MKLKQSFLLLLAATIWGIAFVAQSVGMEYVGAFTFTTTRNIIGTIVLLPVIFFLEKGKSEERKRTEKMNQNKLILGGILCGFFLCVASNLQQFGILYTSVGKSGFITALYIVMVPILGLFLHKKAGLQVWFSVLVAVIGLYLLCMTGKDFQIQKGDLLLLGCAIVFALQILSVDHFSPLVDGVKLAWIQFASCAVFSAIGMFLFETPTLGNIFAAWLPILYAGALSTGVAYTLQIIGQKDCNPTVASLIMSLESVISVIAGWLLLGQKLSTRELSGCAIMFAAIILIQLPEKTNR